MSLTSNPFRIRSTCHFRSNKLIVRVVGGGIAQGIERKYYEHAFTKLHEREPDLTFLLWQSLKGEDQEIELDKVVIEKFLPLERRWVNAKREYSWLLLKPGGRN